MRPTLSILICSLLSRKNKLANLDAQLKSIEHAELYKTDVEVLYNVDKGEKPVGLKRNELLHAACGRYCAFVDDDDGVDKNYSRLILDAIKKGGEPDCIGIIGHMIHNGERVGVFKHSIHYAGWYTGSDGIYYRTPNHLNPVRTEIAKGIGFPSQSKFGEDHNYSIRIKKYLKTEKVVDEPIYYYNV